MSVHLEDGPLTANVPVEFRVAADVRLSAGQLAAVLQDDGARGVGAPNQETD